MSDPNDQDGGPAARDHADSAHALVDRDRPREGNPFDRPDHFTGEDYDIGRERAEGRAVPSGQEDRVETGGDPEKLPGRDNRASFDARTGAVREVHLPEDGGLPSV